MGEGVGAFGPAEEGRGSALGDGDGGAGDVSAVDGGGEGHFGVWLSDLVLRWWLGIQAWGMWCGYLLFADPRRSQILTSILACIIGSYSTGFLNAYFSCL